VHVIGLQNVHVLLEIGMQSLHVLLEIGMQSAHDLLDIGLQNVHGVLVSCYVVCHAMCGFPGALGL